MNTKKQNKDLGTLGERFVLERLIEKGFLLYKRNIRQWGFEIDLVVYKYNHLTKFLDIRIVEVKTRIATTGLYLGNLDNYGLENKWRRLRSRLFMFRDQIVSDLDLDVLGSLSHFDFAIVYLRSGGNTVCYTDDISHINNLLKMHTYIKDINLFI